MLGWEMRNPPADKAYNAGVILWGGVAVQLQLHLRSSPRRARHTGLVTVDFCF